MPTTWPLQSDLKAMRAVYGNPDANNDGAADLSWTAQHLTTIVPPYAMFYAGKRVSKITVNRACAPALLAALTGIGKHYGTSAALAKAGLDQFGGLYNFRPKRSGSGSLSMHAYGVAIDMDPDHNPFKGKTRRMPDDAVRIFKDQGAAWGGDWSAGSYDPMHFQFARVR
jgi:hypothetical protein